MTGNIIYIDSGICEHIYPLHLEIQRTDETVHIHIKQFLLSPHKDVIRNINHPRKQIKHFIYSAFQALDGEDH